MKRLSIPLAAALAITLAACGKKDEPPTPKVAATKPATPAPAVRSEAAPMPGPQRRTDLPEPPPPPPVSVAELTLGKFAGPDRKVDLQSGGIQASDKLFATVATQGAGQVLVKVRWNRLADGKAILITESAKGLTPKGPETHTFEVHNAEGWQPGEYQVEVFVNDQAVATRRFGVS